MGRLFFFLVFLQPLTITTLSWILYPNVVCMSEYISEYEKERKKKESKNVNEKKGIDKEHEEMMKQSKISLKELKDLVKEGAIDLDQKTLDKIQQDDRLDTQELDTVIESLKLKVLLEKIEEIVNNPEIENILPKELRITPKEFKDACIDKDKRPALLIKIDAALDCVNDQVRGG